MSFEYFIAKNIHFQKNAEKRNVSRPAVKIATTGMAVGLVVMIVAISVVVGFKAEIRSKVIGFGGHIQISNFDNNNTYEMRPIEMDSDLLAQIAGIQGIKSVQKFATKPAMIKTDNNFQGVVLKGVGQDFDWDFFKSNLVEGELLNTSSDSLENKVILSQLLCNLLGLKLGDNFLCYFIQNDMRVRKFTIAGVYATNFADYDKMMLLTDIRQVQQLNGWDTAHFGAVEIIINCFDNLDLLGNEVYNLTANHFNEAGETYLTRTIKQMHPQIFSWLALLDMNIWVILGLMLAVAGFCMISGLLILILERANMIGVLKALGSTNWQIRKIFLYHSFVLIIKGMFWGNVIGLAVCALQYFTHIIPLDASAYYVPYVPVEFNFLFIILLNAGTLFASLMMMIAPSYIITNISPSKTIKFE